MIKREVVSAVARRTGCTQQTARLIMDALLAIITQELSDGNAVVLRGFGTFEVRKRAARVGRNIDGGNVKIPEQFAPVFKPGESLKQAVSQLKC